MIKKRSLGSDQDKPTRSSFRGHRVLGQTSPQQCAAGKKLVLRAPGPRTAHGRPVQVKSDVPLQGRRLMETAQAAVGPVSRPLSSPLTRGERPLVPPRGPACPGPRQKGTCKSPLTGPSLLHQRHFTQCLERVLRPNLTETSETLSPGNAKLTLISKQILTQNVLPSSVLEEEALRSGLSHGWRQLGRASGHALAICNEVKASRQKAGGWKPF